MKYKVIRNYNDANKLLALGHKILKIDRDRNNRDYLIFLFEVFIPRAVLMACAPGAAEKDVKAAGGFHVFL